MGETVPRPRGSQAGVLAERLRKQIAKGELQPGDRLPGERELAESFGVHRGSLREALRQLELLRLVSTRPGSGTRVLDPQHASFELIGEQLALDPDGRWLRDLLELRELVASGSVRLLLARHARGSGALAEVVRTLDAIAGPRVPEPAFLEALWGLPASLARASGNQVFLLLANSATRFVAADASVQGVGKGPTPRSEPQASEGSVQGVGKGPTPRSEPQASVAMGLQARERRALAAVLRRLARALEARDAERAERASLELGRRLTACVLAARAAPGSG